MSSVLDSSPPQFTADEATGIAAALFGVQGSASDLGTFLFGEERASLEAYRPILLDVQKGVCLYCRKPLSGKTQVDHFVPSSRYPAEFEEIGSRES